MIHTYNTFYPKSIVGKAITVNQFVLYKCNIDMSHI